MRCYEVSLGQDIAHVLEEMCRDADLHHEPVEAEFNDEKLVAHPGDSPKALLAAWQKRRDVEHAAYAASPEGQAQAAALVENRRVIAEEEKKPLMTFAVKDQAAWDEWIKTNSDGYGAAIIRYAARWANLMEQRLAYGKGAQNNTIATIAEQAGNDADVEGITGFMYGAAVTVLSQVWQHGEELQRWHRAR
jgi:hypothetical protein